MAARIIVPGYILEAIRHDGRKEAERDREATGYLSGYYTEHDDSALVLQRYGLNSQVGDNALIGTAQDCFQKLLHLPKAAYVLWNICASENRFRRIGRTPAEIFYHTHSPRNGYDSWSPDDLRTARRYNEHSKRRGIKWFALLYKVSGDVFEAIDTDGRKVDVESS